jgi:hypothetical protein
MYDLGNFSANVSNGHGAIAESGGTVTLNAALTFFELIRLNYLSFVTD